jgi:hypothetical protein
MARTKETVEDWKCEARETGATHIAVVMDKFLNEPYPVFIRDIEDFNTTHRPFLESRGYQEILRVIEVK